uniref:PiggyBac transposable element-derived protein domain-containing protein n=1 Tax=Electrophorus electricus TaxID=8005 RepID=A0A4W4G4I4_ELEEL
MYNFISSFREGNAPLSIPSSLNSTGAPPPIFLSEKSSLSTTTMTHPPPNLVRRQRSVSDHVTSSPAIKRASAAVLATSEQDRWNNIDEDDVSPVLHPFSPARTPGVQLDCHQEYTPLQLFQLFFDKSVIKVLCKNTNKYAQHRLKNGMKTLWNPVCDRDIYKYLSLVIYCGLLKASTIRDLWRKDRLLNLPFPSSVMAGFRFEAISSNLHMSDIEETMKNDKLKGTPGCDRLFRLKPLMEQILIACKAYYHPYQNISIDERMVATKARISMKQYMKNKPTKWGYKLFVLADSKNGYTCAFDIYQGKVQTHSGKGLAYDTVMNLLSTCSLGTGYHIYVDNFYTSTTLFRDLHKKRYEACGTIRNNQIDFAQIPTNALSKRAIRGDIKWIRDGPLLYVKWMDTREVTVCSTIHKAYKGETVQRRVRNHDGTWSLKCVPVPEPVKAYNKHMGGVDLSDALIKYFSVTQKTVKWYRKLFLHFVDIALVNSYIIYKEQVLAKNQKPLTQKKFREVLCLQLADFENDATTTQQGPTKPEVVVQRKKQKKTIYKCRSCDVPLCIVADRICFTEWHELGLFKGSKSK